MEFASSMFDSKSASATSFKFSQINGLPPDWPPQKASLLASICDIVTGAPSAFHGAGIRKERGFSDAFCCEREPDVDVGLRVVEAVEVDDEQAPIVLC